MGIEEWESMLSFVTTSDNVCIEAMSVNISRRTLERSENNLGTLERKIRECVRN